MPSCQFSAIQAIPSDLGAHTPANVGVILYDPDKNIAYRKLTDNWQEVFRITGFRYSPRDGEPTEHGPFSVEDDYLENLARGQFMDSLQVAPPKNLIPFDTHEEALRWAYASQVSIAALDAGGDGRADMAGKRLRERIAGAHFPEGSYRALYRFELGRPAAMRFPNVFLADGRPYKALFAVSLGAQGSYGIVKKRICEAATIRRRAGTDTVFAMCTTQAKQEIDMGRPRVRDSLDLAKEWDVEVIHWDMLDGELARIRGAVSEPPLQRSYS